MSLELRRRLFAELNQQVIIDPHTHINPLAPAARHLDDILGYHYYTELSHSTGLPREEIEAPGQSPQEKVGLLMSQLGTIDNTAQYSWFVELSQKLFGFTGDYIDASNWEEVFSLAEQKMSAPDWSEQVLAASKVEALFLTNDFDDPLEGFDSNTYIPCLRTDDLVFHLAKDEVRGRLEQATGVSLQDAGSLRLAIERLFRHFKLHGARACAISLPPDFTPARVTQNRANVALDAVLRNGEESFESHRRALGNFVFWTLAEMCERYKLPFDLMIGVNRNVYPAGVHQGRDLYDSRVSLLQYKELFNAFPRVTFPVSVLASVTNQELVSYAWIFPNVVTNGHWWYSNTPAYIEHDLAARLEAVPRTKQIGYYSDAYKLEFIQPKFAMYKRSLAKVLAEQFVLERGWSEARAVELGKQVLRGNVDSIFRMEEDPRAFEMPAELEYASSKAGTFSAPITAGEEETASPFDATSAAGIAAASLGGAAMLGGLRLGTGYEELPLRPASDEFVLHPGSSEGSDISLEPAPIALTTSESGFALDELDGPGNAAGDLNLDDLQMEMDLDKADAEFSAELDNDLESPSGDSVVAEVQEEPGNPFIAETVAFAGTDDHLEPSTLDSLRILEQEPALELDNVEEMIPTLDLDLVEPEADGGEIVESIELDLDAEIPAAIDPPQENKPGPMSFEIPDPPKKKDDGGMNFDFLK